MGIIDMNKLKIKKLKIENCIIINYIYNSKFINNNI